MSLLFSVPVGKAVSGMCFQRAVWGKLVQYLLIQHLPAWRKRRVLLCCSQQRRVISRWNKIEATSEVYSLSAKACRPGSSTGTVQGHTEPELRSKGLTLSLSERLKPQKSQFCLGNSCCPEKKGKTTGLEETHPRVWPNCLHGGSNQTLSGAEKSSWAMQQREPVGDETSPGGHRS